MMAGCGGMGGQTKLGRFSAQSPSGRVDVQMPFPGACIRPMIAGWRRETEQRSDDRDVTRYIVACDTVQLQTLIC